ncbi:cyclic nucleotide-gated cation channel alpha-4 [Tachysurus vachellii]|uniref:cyclic nucleotide-gated cation channel alpha-4 n=1 Tax=Tachysurus vachellii TaxID=175792 RepID=UPI00296A9857|nr:cyclic nucleotide-gated cation channel alpha-4 [Tachysurus vachellii]
MNRWAKLLSLHHTQNGEAQAAKEEGLKEEKKEQKTKVNWKEWVIDPSEEFYYGWLQVMIFPIIYNWVVIILRVCFSEVDQTFQAIWYTLDYISDLVYVADIFVKFRTGFLEQGILVRDMSRLKKRYLHSSQFFLDVLSQLPTDLLYLNNFFKTPLVRINRFLRSPRLSETLDRMETRTAYPNVFRISKLMILIFILIHWNACLYFALSQNIGFGSDNWVYPGLRDSPGLNSTRHQYFYSFWFSTLILTMVGDTPNPVCEEEFLFMIADLLIAVLVFASVMGSVGNVIMNLRDRDNVFFPNHELVKSYLRSRRINKMLHNRVNAWYQHLHINKKITRENEILQQLPVTLQTAIAVSVHLPTLSKVTIFQNCESSLLEQLVLKLMPQVYNPGEYVCRKGDVGHEMYIIKEGKLAVVADDGVTQFAVLGDGNFFGEISILNIKGNKSGNRRTANIRSIGYSDLFSLSKEDLTNTLSEFPAAKRLLEEKGRQILTKMGMLEVSDEVEEEKEKMEDKVVRIGSSLETLQTKLARLMVELESSVRKMMNRVAQLELQTEGWEGIVAEGAGSETEDETDRKREVGDGKGEGDQEKEPQGERGEGDGGEEDKDVGKEAKKK